MNPGGNKSGYPGSQLKGCNMAMFLLKCLIGKSILVTPGSQ